jgi:hypothetical protein
MIEYMSSETFWMMYVIDKDELSLGKVSNSKYSGSFLTYL